MLYLCPLLQNEKPAAIPPTHDNVFVDMSGVSLGCRAPAMVLIVNTWFSRESGSPSVFSNDLMCLSVQVINIINAAQESSPMPVAEALDRVLEILRTTELYSPQLGTKDEDPHTNDLVGGLMTVGE